MNTYHIHIQGQVQGVGFRPFIWRLARSHALLGWVNNSSDGLHIRLNAEDAALERFLDVLRRDAPKRAYISGYTTKIVEEESFDAFSIIHSDVKTAPDLVLSPDFALCPDCRGEMQQPGNRRHNYAFITCTLCGPRFSITQQLPYDRDRTTMRSFVMCAACQEEYNNPEDRRYYSQTNSCPACGVSVRLEGDETINNPELLDRVRDRLQQGQILAVKGIGGFLLICDATRPEAIQKLRERKRRPSKPLAVLYPDATILAGDVVLKADDKALLESPAAPIVLLPLLAQPASGICTALLAPSLDRLGVMLPYAPLLEQIAGHYAKPLVATSGNISGSPIFYTDEQAHIHLSSIADGTLTHNREIVVPQDDSVVQLTPWSRQPVFLRRSRGYAPAFFEKTLLEMPKSVLAFGAELKSTFAWQHNKNVYISPYLGNLDNFDTHERFELVLRHFLEMLQSRPQSLVADKHPGYFSTQFAARMAAEWQAPLHKVQHHEAHFAAVLGENKLLATDQPILGVIWDGTGLGDDGQIWGGEFFIFENGLIRRTKHLEYFQWLLGDKMAREPRLSALSACFNPGEEPAHLRPKFTDKEWSLYLKMLASESLLLTSSMGRLFDAVASLLGLADKTSFEGEAAMRLEALARQYFAGASLPEALAAAAYPLDGLSAGSVFQVKSVLKHLLTGLEKGESKAFLAGRWHLTLVQMVWEIAADLQVHTIAFSGGVFQNSLLVDLLLHYLQPQFQLYFHQQLSPNDECIAYGQLVAKSLFSNS